MHTTCHIPPDVYIQHTAHREFFCMELRMRSSAGSQYGQILTFRMRTLNWHGVNCKVEHIFRAKRISKSLKKTRKHLALSHKHFPRLPHQIERHISTMPGTEVQDRELLFLTTTVSCTVDIGSIPNLCSWCGTDVMLNVMW